MRDFFFNRRDVSHRRCARPHHRLRRRARSRPMPSPNTSTPARPRSFPRATCSTISPPRVPPRSRRGTIIVAEGYMDVIALVRAGFAHAVAPLGTALTEDQLQLLWRTAPEPILAFDGDDAGLQRRPPRRASGAAASEARLFAALCLPAVGRGSRQLHRRARAPAAMRKLLEEAVPLSQVLWRAETEGKDFSTPERRAGLERALAEIVAADRRRQDRRLLPPRLRAAGVRGLQAPQAPAAEPRAVHRQDRPFRGRAERGRFPAPSGTAEAVSAAVKASLLARAGQAGAPAHVKETGTGRIPAGRPRNRRPAWGNPGRAALFGPPA